MTDTLRDRIAKAVLDKILVMFTENDPVESASAYIADAILALPGIAVVELPELMANREEVPQSIRHQPMWEQKHAWATIQDGDGLIYFENGSDGVAYGTVNPAEARDLAATLLAAAEYAEKESE